MKIELSKEINADDLLKGIAWYGETDHDNEAIERIKALEYLTTDLSQKLFFLKYRTSEIAVNQNNISAKQISEAIKNLLKQQAKMSLPESTWEELDRLFEIDLF